MSRPGTGDQPTVAPDDGDSIGPSRRRLGVLLAIVVIAASASLLTVARRMQDPPGGEGPTIPLPAPTTVSPVTDLTSGDFAGSEQCAECHRSEYDAWRSSTHAAAGGPAGRVQVIAPFDGTPIRFRDGEVIPTSSGGRYAFTVRQRDRAEQVYRVDGVIGGGHMQGGGTQGFVSRFDDGTLRFLPFDFARQQGVWFCNTNSRLSRGWIPITPDLALADCGDWPPARVLGDEARFSNCQSCHGSQITVTLDTAAQRYRTSVGSLGVNCESCHGPGKAHIALAASPSAVASGETGMTALATLSKDASLGTCWQCHALKDEIRPGFVSGQRLETHFSLLMSQLGTPAYYADGRVKTFAYQQGHLYSDCYLSGSMTCTSCHDPHSQGYRDVAGAPLPGRVADRQCTGCHASKSDRVAEHTKHAPGSAGSRCVSCHMPYLQEPEVGSAVQYARSDHSIAIPRPAFDSSLGVVNACAGCHRERGTAALQSQVTRWYGALKPHPRAVTALLALQRDGDAGDSDDVSLAVLDTAERNTAALFAGLASFAERRLTPDMVSLDKEIHARLEGLARHRDLDVRALALASLHHARGTRRATRDFLSQQLRGLGAAEADVRARWAVALGFFADRLRDSGNTTGSVLTYQKALEIQPASARVLLNLGLAFADAGGLAQAVDSYRRSLTIDGRQPLALINLGIALEAGHDLAAAIASYRQAIAINAHEPLAYVNLGNALAKSGDVPGAIPFWQRAVTLDPTISLANFNLARAWAQQGAMKKALDAMDRGLEFDPRNAEMARVRDEMKGSLTTTGAR